MMFVNNEDQNRRYQGYNPAFYRRARQKQERDREVEERQRTAKRRAAMEAAKISLRRRHNRPLDNTLPTRELVRAFVEANGYSWKEVVGTSRRRPLVAVRQEAMRLARLRGLSLPQIGMMFNRDHTTVLHALNRETRSEHVPVSIESLGAGSCER